MHQPPERYDTSLAGKGKAALGNLGLLNETNDRYNANYRKVLDQIAIAELRTRHARVFLLPLEWECGRLHKDIGNIPHESRCHPRTQWTEVERGRLRVGKPRRPDGPR